jgi:spheroidene monooxygenase
MKAPVVPAEAPSFLRDEASSPGAFSLPRDPSPSSKDLTPRIGSLGRVAVLLLADIAPRFRLWGYARFVVQRFAMRGIQGLVLFKVMGCGHGGGFGLRPSTSRQALFCLFENDEAADHFLASAVVAQYAARSREFCTAKLHAYSCRGSWSGTSIAITQKEPLTGPIFTITRASIRLSRMFAFWRIQPASELALNQAQGCLFATGVGEAPFLRQATLSLWSSTQAMDAYARSGAHLAAIQAAYAGNYFSESMFARFVPSSLQGDWRGKHYGPSGL